MLVTDNIDLDRLHGCKIYYLQLLSFSEVVLPEAFHELSNRLGWLKFRRLEVSRKILYGLELAGSELHGAIARIVHRQYANLEFHCPQVLADFVLEQVTHRCHVVSISIQSTLLFLFLNSNRRLLSSKIFALQFTQQRQDLMIRQKRRSR